MTQKFRSDLCSQEKIYDIIQKMGVEANFGKNSMREKIRYWEMQSEGYIMRCSPEELKRKWWANRVKAKCGP